MPKNTRKIQGKKSQQKLKLSNKQFDDLLKEIGGGLPEGLALDPSLLAALRQATDEQFNKVAVEKYGVIPEGTDNEDGDEEKEMEEEDSSEQKETKEEPKEQEQQPSSSKNS
ncbi:unnamed protein product [Caenorhabditis sp. 36 PRJEB53466]|nr:unnamed protein product [Caenorhabditis sp. 36 PRJEB53466]